MPCPSLGTLGPYSHPMRRHSRKDPTRPTSYERDPCAVSVVTYVNLAARFRTAASSSTLVNGLAKIRAVREHDRASIYAHTPQWEERFLKTSMAFSTLEVCEHVRQVDRTGKIADSPSGKRQKASTTLLCDTIRKRDFALPIAKRAPKFCDRSVDIMWRRV